MQIIDLWRSELQNGELLSFCVLSKIGSKISILRILPIILRISGCFLSKNPSYRVQWGTTVTNTTPNVVLWGFNSAIVLLFAHFNDHKDFPLTKKWGASYPK